MNQYLLAACIGLAAVVIALSVALIKSGGIASARIASPQDTITLGSPSGNAGLPDPNNSGPHQINIVIDGNLKFCVGTNPDGSGPMWVVQTISGRKYLVLLSNTKCP